jgi:hypothetical protein
MTMSTGIILPASIILNMMLCALVTHAQEAKKIISPTKDVRYNQTGDPNAIKSGTYVTEDLRKAIDGLQSDEGAAKAGGSKLKLEAGIYRSKASSKGFTIDQNNSFIEGDGMGTTTIHFEAQNSSNEIGFKYAMPANVPDRLIRGGGLQNITLKTDNANIVSYGLQIDYAEYMQFKNLSIENFAISALFGCFWESNFENLVFRASGAAQKQIAGVPQWGVLDFDSHSTIGNRDACNNTNFSKITFSSCFGTHIRCVANANTNVNINMYGLYDESYPGEGGDVDELPIYYFKGTKNFNVIGGFLTINPTATNRNAYAVRIASDSRNGQVSFTNFEFLQNHGGGGFAPNAIRRLSAFIYLEKNQSIALTNVTVNDASGSVGKGLSSPHLIDGESGSTVFFQNVNFHIKKGVWNIDNIISPLVNKQGTIAIVFYDNNGPTGEMEYYTFQLGKNLSGNAK